MVRPLLVMALVAGALSLADPAQAQEEAPTPAHQSWSFDGVFGTYDLAAAQRGLQVYKDVCAACHPVKHLYFRDLEELGYSDDQIKGIAAQYQVTDGPNDEGQMFQRPAKPSDHIPGPFPNDQAARTANNGALPPDLSLIVKAREGGPDYVYGILTGFKDAPPNVQVPDGMYYNEYFPGHNIKMPPPLSDGQVSFAEGAPNKIPDEARDVVTFLTWAAEPNLDQRHEMGIKVILFLIVAAGLFYAAKRKIWARVH